MKEGIGSLINPDALLRFDIDDRASAGDPEEDEFPEELTKDLVQEEGRETQKLADKRGDIEYGFLEEE